MLGNAERLARWLEAQLLVEHYRPLELRKGVLHAGTFRYREHNSGLLGSEEFPDPGAVDRREADMIPCGQHDQHADRGSQSE